MPKSLSLRKQRLRRDSDFGENRIFMSLVLNKKTRLLARFLLGCLMGVEPTTS